MKDNVIGELINSIKEAPEEPQNAYSAVVSKVDSEGVVWVHLAGSDKETPTASTSAEIKSGDIVTVEWRNNKLYIAGNYSNPSAGTERVVRVEAAAQNAENTANNAEATAQSAQESAAAAHQIAADTEQHFWFTETGADTGAHITEVTQEEWNDSNSPNYHSGGNLLARSNGIAVREGVKELATMSQSGFDAKTYDSNDNEVVIAHLGYGPGKDGGGGTSEAPYYTLGTRATGSHVGNYSVAEGDAVIASGYASHAEGQNVTASGTLSHAEGASTTASSYYSHAEGSVTTASGDSSHAEGTFTTASGVEAHAEGAGTIASGKYSHAQNLNTKASKGAQTALGTYNEEDTSATTTHPSGIVDYGEHAVIIGNGTGNLARSNALTVDWNGDVELAGGLTLKGHASEVGSLSTRYTGTQSLPNNTLEVTPSSELTRLSLGIGTWLIVAHATFPSNSTGQRYLAIYDVTTSARLADSVVSQPSVANDVTRMQATVFISPSSEQTFTLQLYQNSGSAQNVDVSIQAVRIA